MSDKTIAYPNLKNPPIHEVIITFRFHKIDKGVFETIVDSIRNEKIASLGKISKIDITEKKSKNSKVVSYEIFFKGSKNTILFTSTKLAYRYLTPYKSQDKLFSDFERIWSNLKGVFPLAAASSVGIRFINALQFQSHDWYHYIRIKPQIIGRSKIKGAISSYIVEPEDGGLNGLVTVIHQPSEKLKTEVIFDINVYKKIESKLSNYRQVLKVFKELKQYVNELFFHNIGTKALEEFQK